jgi:2,4-dienoyl-CoA reductase-like NADH-dependent reductase (Old Yellow Enzyme family)
MCYLCLTPMLNRNAILDKDNPWDPVPYYREFASIAHAHGALILAQLQFPGRQVPDFINKNPLSSSDVQLKPCLLKSYGRPRPMTQTDIDDLKQRYVWAATKLYQAGIDGIVVRLCLSPAFLQLVK